MKSFRLLILAFILIPVCAFAGRESGAGGGNAFEAEFRHYGSVFWEAVFEHQTVEIEGKKFDQAPLKDGLAKLQVSTTTKPLTLNGKTVTAINYPTESRIVFNTDAWSKLDSSAKMQLVIHELLGLKYRSVFDDSKYRFSNALLKVTESFTVESVALAMARAGNAYDYRMKLVPERTKIVETKPDSDGLGNYIITEVAIRTFENSSDTSIRVYRVKEHDMLGVISAELDHLEGAAGG